MTRIVYHARGAAQQQTLAARQRIARLAVHSSARHGGRFSTSPHTSNKRYRAAAALVLLYHGTRRASALRGSKSKRAAARAVRACFQGDISRGNACCASYHRFSLALALAASLPRDNAQNERISYGRRDRRNIG